MTRSRSDDIMSDFVRCVGGETAEFAVRSHGDDPEAGSAARARGRGEAGARGRARARGRGEAGARVGVRPEPGPGVGVRPEPGVGVRPEPGPGVGVRPEPGVGVRPEPGPGVGVRPEPGVGVGVKVLSARETEEEELDPRIQEELEHLNQASEEINKVELHLDEARNTYRKILSESAKKLKAQGSQLGSCIEKARPYYESRRLAKDAQQETQRVALRYERAVSMHNAAREMVYVAEQGLMADRNRLDPTWQEMLNHATAKVNEAEEERLRGEREHHRVTRQCQEAEARVQELQKSLKRVIIKSKPYFELKAQFNHILEEHKGRVTGLEQTVSQAKTRYAVALRNLEQISEEIHARRGSRAPRSPRASPVGAEAGSPPSEMGEGEEGGKLGALCAEGSASDSISVLSFQTIASDLQKCDSVEHLGEFLDVLSLDSQELGLGGEGGEGGGLLNHRLLRPPGQRGRGQGENSQLHTHHRSVSL
ncbi:SH3 domain-binding protein 5-like [Callorhinchus milii]|uniref:SH3 domain-binding protein 5-like n=1 Tax=Callorhinchus milii TaxID=7868 RepID=UPI001C3FCD11|nr:SH3 domain-binding protein 5-like [Callorhinchus milii]